LWLNRFIVAAATPDEGLARAFASDGGASGVKAGRRCIAFTPILRWRYMTVAAALVESS
tara:strand:+ start:725 stop:901 length:177 start_codon:yes stop_codon:yes gene_type:complete